MTTPDNALIDAARGREPIVMQPGDDLHLTLLMAQHGLNFFTGQDRQQLLAWGRAVWQAASAPATQGQGGYVLEDDKFSTYLDGQLSRFSIRRKSGEHLAWISGDLTDDGESIAHEVMRALIQTPESNDKKEIS